ncbi:MAG: ABC transporter ATP-binding protein [Candidatus Cloacimonetes bacterium]|nr:ABC transporter ATP-binding protein [Candidatus Cloacimonadota bacterium]
MKDLKLLLPRVKKHWILILFSFFGAAIVALSTTANAEVLKFLLDKVLVVPAEVDVQTHYRTQTINLYWVTFLAVFVTMMRGLGEFIKSYTLSFVQQRIILGLRRDFFSHLQKLPLNFYARSRTGDLLARMSSDILAIENMLRQMINTLAEPLIIVCLIGYMFHIYWKLAILIFVILPVLGLTVRSLSVRLRNAGKLLQAKTGDITALLQESVLGIKIIKAFGMQNLRNEFFERESEANFKYSMKSVKYVALTNPIVEFADSIGVALMIYFGAKGVIDQEISAGELIAFLTCLGLVFQPIKKITNANGVIQSSMAGLRRVFEILEEEVEEDLGQRPIPKESHAGDLLFDNISFSFQPDNPVLTDLSLSIKQGSMVALVGPSGAGKTSLLNLIPRFYELDSGSIRYAGHDIREYPLEAYRSLIGIVPQETMLFSGTVRDNVLMARPDASEADLIQACKMANAHNFLMDLPKGYDTVVAELGVGLSGGQKQRIAIARAILKNPAILLLDEATSALDNESERLVQESLKLLMKNRTTLVIAHRISTIMDADLIVVMARGKIEDMGKHDELLKRCSLYAKLCRNMSHPEEVHEA